MLSSKSVGWVVGVVLGLAAGSATAGTEDLYKQSCATCHGAGVLGAPKAGDRAAWEQRMKEGMPALLKHAKEGYKNMPARGLCDRCSDEDYANLIRYMATK